MNSVVRISLLGILLFSLLSCSEKTRFELLDASGANVLAATRVAAELGPGHNVVTVLCDRGERYLSSLGHGPH